MRTMPRSRGFLREGPGVPESPPNSPRPPPIKGWGREVEGGCKGLQPLAPSLKLSGRMKSGGTDYSSSPGCSFLASMTRKGMSHSWGRRSAKASSTRTRSGRIFWVSACQVENSSAPTR